MVYFIFDNPNDKDKMEFLKKYPTETYKQLYPSYRLLSVWDMVRYVLKVIKESGPNDKLIFWYDFMGVLCWWICKFTLKKRDIIILNILLKEKNSLKNKTARFLYKYVLKNNIIATVTSVEYGNWLNNLLGIKRDYCILHDIYFGDAESMGLSIEKYVFCGGRNGRDWNKLIEIANRLPLDQFVAVMPKNDYQNINVDISNNLKVECDIPEDKFNTLLAKSALVVMPLNTQAPAGLIALFQAGSYKKCVITSDTVTIKEYIDSEKGAVCTSLESWVSSIDYLLHNPKEAEQRANKYNEFLNKKCSMEIYANSLYKIVGE